MTRLRYVPEEDRWVEVEKGLPVLYFKDFESAQLTRTQAAEVGAHFDEKDGVTTFRSERQLREHLARERDAGRDLRWREH